MSLLFYEGFGHVDDGYELLKWDAYASSFGVTYAAGYGALSDWGMRLEASISYYVEKIIGSDISTSIVGVRINPAILNDSNQIVTFMDSGTVQGEVRALADGSVGVYRGESTLIASSSGGKITASTWQYLQIKIKWHNSTGTVDVKVGSESIISDTGLDTSSTGNEYINKFRLCSNGGITYYDDFYLCDTAGSIRNDFLGDIRIVTLYPISDGTYTDFTPSTGSDHYALVDDPQLVSDTDHNESATIGHKDSYGMTTFSEAGTILGVQICGAVNNTSTGSMSVRTLCRSGGTPADNEGSNFSLSQTKKGALTIHEQEPTDTVDWTAAKINASEPGLKIQS